MVKYISYKGKQLPIRISYAVLKAMKEVEKVSITTMKDDDYSTYEKLLFHALRKGHEVESMEFKFKKEDMEDILDETFFEFVKIIPEFFPKADMPVMGATEEVVAKKLK